MVRKNASTMGLRFIVVLAIAIVFGILYFVWLGGVGSFGKDLGDYSICKTSNIANARDKIRISNQIIDEGQDINKCVTEYVNVKKGTELRTISNKMVNCWDMYLEGKEELFATEDNNYCAICSVLEFEDKKPITGLIKYLIDHNLAKKDVSYYEYLNRMVVEEETLSEIENTEIKDLDVIDTSKRQAIMFIMEKDVNPGSLTGKSSIVSGGGVGLGGTALLGLSRLIGVGLCSSFVGCTAGAFLVGGGSYFGYSLGSDYLPDTDARILLWPYTQEGLSQLQCTVLEGKNRLTRYE